MTNIIIASLQVLKRLIAKSWNSSMEIVVANTSILESSVKKFHHMIKFLNIYVPLHFLFDKSYSI